VTKNEILTGAVLDESVEMSFEELCRSCSTRRETILSMVEEGILTPVNRAGSSWRFSGVAVVRAVKATKLQRDLDLNLPGVALALELLEEIERLRDRLRRLEPGGEDAFR
jgi:chaperone modulatory protein CbpM